MKKITTLFLIIFAICLLTACRTEPATEPQTQAPTEIAPSVSPENTALTPTPTPTPTQPTETIPPEPVDTSIEEWRKLAYEYINWERRYTKQGADLDKLKIGMSYEEVVEIFGRGWFQGLYSGMPRPLFVLGKPDAFAWVLSDDVRYTFKETMVSMTIYFENSAIHDNGKELVAEGKTVSETDKKESLDTEETKVIPSEETLSTHDKDDQDIVQDPQQSEMRQGQLFPDNNNSDLQEQLPIIWMRNKKQDVRPVFNEEEKSKLISLGYEPVKSYNDNVMKAIAGMNYDPEKEKCRFSISKSQRKK